jgi:signal transduction histidine kinase
VANAVNYTQIGSVKLSAIIQSTTAAEGDSSVVQVQFTVTDTGKGISKSEQSKLFLPYVRGGRKLPTFAPLSAPFSSSALLFLPCTYELQI